MNATPSKRIGILIPTTSKGRSEWNTIVDTYLFKYTMKTFLQTRSPQHHYTFYIGVDNDDRVFSMPANRQLVYQLKADYPKTSYKFISMAGAEKGHLTKMWNILFRYAYDQGCDYFFQCGDDINFKSKYWVDDAICVLEKNNNVGVTAPICVAEKLQQPKILTQSFVSRKHMEIFGWYFPESIVNWFCDNWINDVYTPNNHFPLINHHCCNDGGPERYAIGTLNSRIKAGSNFLDNFKKPVQQSVDLHKLYKEARDLASKHKQLIEKFLKK